ncbi:L-lactate dehydrogenase B chain isoform X2 [Drosophila navojoa]|uniref:L-lactate dehydrogenase B chain isoform X2 n=1 Tax=Drosophila navojoa TaxID=7232 RepID=UPI0011BF7158|nr:L-lactate dehydrogenase B chain isoform X2 [Drosophila navojoa]
MREQEEKEQKENEARTAKALLFRSTLYKTNSKQDFQAGNKVSIVGAGPVGMGCAFALLTKRVTNNIAIYDVKNDLSSAERQDLLQGSLFLHNCKIDNRTTIECTKNSRVIVITAGVRSKPNESRQNLVHRSAEIIKKIAPELLKQSPKAVFIVVSNPVDVMTWVTRKITNLPYERCFSTGCHLDTARFRMFIGKLLRVSTSSVQGMVLGEHGDTSVPIWSSVSVGGTLLKDLLPPIGTEKDPMAWSNVHKNVVDAAYKVIGGKGYTNWAVGLTVSDVVSAIFENSNRILSLSTNAKGMCGVKEEVFLSLPCIVNKWGIYGVLHPQLSDWEKNKFEESAKVMLKLQNSIKF